MRDSRRSLTALLSWCLGLGTVLAGCGGSGGAKPTTTLNVPGVGELMCNDKGDVIEALGIPYATPPVAKLRFQPPLPAKYSSPINATSFGPACMQAPSVVAGALPMSEDCLSLNVFTPKNRPKKMPVFFWIHGGGFLGGDALHYNGTHLAKLGVVVVTIQYRLGALGYLVSDEIAREGINYTGTGGAIGFLDQLLALRWVRDHIGAFGGDPSQITIAGESAGSTSVCTHMHVPASNGLFHRAVMESGSCIGGCWAVSWWNGERMKGKSNALMKESGASNLAALRNVSASQLAKSEHFNIMPSPDGDIMKDLPTNLPLLSKNLDVIIGSNTMDTGNAPPYIAGNPDAWQPNGSSQAYVSMVTDYFGEAVWNAIPRPDKNTSKEKLDNEFYSLNAVVCNSCPKHWAAKKFLGGDNRVYVYEFGYSKTNPGMACHMCETQDVFNMPTSVAPNAPKEVLDELVGSYDPSLGDAMSKYWTSFAKGGVPEAGVAWPRYQGPIGDASSQVFGAGADGKPAITSKQGLGEKACNFFADFIKESDENAMKYQGYCTYAGPAPKPPEVLVI